MQLLAIVGTTALLAGAAGGFWLGDGLASGRYEKRIADISKAIAEAQNTAVERYNLALEAERKRANEAQNKRSQQHSLAQEVIHEVAADTDRSCEWREPHRLRIEALYSAYGYASTGSSLGMSHSLPTASVEFPSERAVGSSSIQLGSRLRSSTQ